jgi:hypothetical protein
MMLQLREKHQITVNKIKMKKLQVLLLGLIFSAISFAHDDHNDPVVLTIDGFINQSSYISILKTIMTVIKKDTKRKTLMHILTCSSIIN